MEIRPPEPETKMCYKELLLKDFDCFPSKLTIVSKEAKTTEDNTTTAEYEEHVIHSSLLGQATFEWDENTKQLNSKPKRLVILRIKQFAQELTNTWDYNAGSNPTTYDPPYLLHVGQDRDSPEGNCYKYHLEINETPCTLWDQVSKNEEDRIEEERNHKAQKIGRPLRKRAEKKKRGRRKR